MVNVVPVCAGPRRGSKHDHNKSEYTIKAIVNIPMDGEASQQDVAYANPSTADHDGRYKGCTNPPRGMADTKHLFHLL